jgi:hypothetical protein
VIAFDEDACTLQFSEIEIEPVPGAHLPPPLLDLAAALGAAQWSWDLAAGACSSSDGRWTGTVTAEAGRVVLTSSAPLSVDAVHAPLTLELE